MSASLKRIGSTITTFASKVTDGLKDLSNPSDKERKTSTIATRFIGSLSSAFLSFSKHAAYTK